MHDSPPLPPRKADVDHLNLLSILHFVGAGFALLGVLFLLMHFSIFYTVFNNPKLWENEKQGPPPAELFDIFKWFYLVLAIWFITSGILSVLSGLFLRARKHRMFSMVVAGIICVHAPLGTALGVFTIIVLLRDSVRELYEAK